MLVSECDTLKAGDPLLTLETEKAAVDVPSPFSGTIQTLFVKKGSKSKAGDKICEISSDGKTSIHEKRLDVAKTVSSLITGDTKSIAKTVRGWVDA